MLVYFPYKQMSSVGDNGLVVRLIDNVAPAARLLVLTVNVETVVIGSGISSLGEPVLEAGSTLREAV